MPLGTGSDSVPLTRCRREQVVEKNMAPDRRRPPASSKKKNMEFIYISTGPRDTLEAGKILGASLTPGSVIGLAGELGAGKTCFIKGMAYGINRTPEDEVTSPTFAILQEYAGSVPLYHLDAYRITGSDDLETVGLEDCMDAGGIVVIEWADRIEDALPEEHLMISIEVMSEQKRKFIFKPSGVRYRAAVNELHAALVPRACT